MSAGGDSIRCPMNAIYRGVLWATAILGAAAALVCAAELIGIAPRGSLIGEAHDVERIAALLFGLAMAWFSWSVLSHGRLELDEDYIGILRYGIVCRTERIPFARIRRHGHGTIRSQGRRQQFLLLELDDGTRREPRLSMFSGTGRLLAELERRLGPPSPTRGTMVGMRFLDDA